MRNILGVSGGIGLVVLVAAFQIHGSQGRPGGLVPGNAFAQEPGRSSSDDQQGAPDVGEVLQQLQDSAFATTLVPNAPSDAPPEATPRLEPRRDRQFSQTPQRWTLTPTPWM